MNSKTALKELWKTLIKLNHKLTKEQWQDFNVTTELKISLEPNEINLLKHRFGKYFEITPTKIKMK